MPTCDACGKHESLPYNCRGCGGVYCGEHRLPENHSCPGLDSWGDPKGVFDSGFDDSVADSGRDRGIADRLGIDTGAGGPMAYFRNNMTYVFLALMWLTFGIQILLQSLFGSLFTLQYIALDSLHVFYVWTWITSIFAHGSFMHILFNSIVLYFFGPIVERKVGSKMFTVLFLASGVIAGLAQVLTGLVLGDFSAVVGASGAILAVMGVLTVLNPNLRVLLFFFIPMPLWLLTAGFALISVFVMLGGGLGAGGIAHLAHLAGLAIGLLYGEKLRREGATAPNQLQLGGGGPGGPGGGFGGPGRRF